MPDRLRIPDAPNARRGLGVGLLLLAMAAASAGPGVAAVWHVAPNGSGDFPSIQAAIDGSSAGDIIELANGTYVGSGNHDIVFNKLVTLRSASGDPASCVIDLGGGFGNHGIFATANLGPAATIQGITIAHSYGGEGAALLLELGASSSPTIRNCVFRDHSAAYDSFHHWYYNAFAVRTNGGSPLFDGCTFRNCISPDGEAGGLICRGGTPVIRNCSFEENVARFGSGLSATGDSGLLSVENCEFVDNGIDGPYPTDGGGMWIRMNASISGCHFTGNQAASGAGIYVTGTTIGRTFDCHDCEFSDGPSAGGSIEIQFSGNTTESIRDCLFLDNSLNTSAILVWSSTGIEVTRCTFARNNLASGTSIVWCTSSSDATLTNCTFWGNQAGSATGTALVNSQSSTVHVQNCLLAFNDAGPPVICSGTTPQLSCCDIFGNADGDWVGAIAGQAGINGNMSADPLLCSPETDDWHLRSQSPCRPFSPPNPLCNLIGAWPVGCALESVPDGGPGNGFALGGAAPNPFFASTRVTFALAHPATIRASVFDAGGRRVRSLPEVHLAAGPHSLSWTGLDDAGSRVPSGIYLCRISVDGNEVGAARVVYLR